LKWVSLLRIRDVIIYRYFTHEISKIVDNCNEYSETELTARRWNYFKAIEEYIEFKSQDYKIQIAPYIC